MKLQKTSEYLFAESLDIESLAWDTGFYQREPKKITASLLFFSFWKMQQKGKNTLRNWCLGIGEQIGDTVAKQSLNERLDEKSVALCEVVLKKALSIRMDTERLEKDKASLRSTLKPFNRVFLRDSTVQQLPPELYEYFKGMHCKGEPLCLTRIQALFNFTEEKWEHFSVNAYSVNDQKAAPEIAEELQEGDLLLQDLGYFTLNWLGQVIEKQFIITKWDNKTKLLDLNGKELCLPELFKNQSKVDMPVLVGKKKKLPMRLVVKKLPHKQAKERIEKARKDRHKDTNHSEEYYWLLRYEIYLTNVEQNVLNVNQIAKLYGLRWHIEILFKSWKSYANFKQMFAKEKMQVHRVKFTIYAMLILFVFMMDVYHFVKDKIKCFTRQHLSILKFMDVVNDFFSIILRIKILEELIRLIPQFAKHAVYQKHSKRKNTIEKYLYVNELCVT